MRNATIKSLIFLALIATIAGLAGCSSPEEKRAQQLQDALSLSENGQNTEAIEILEELSALYPNDLEVLESMGRIYVEEGDFTTAAFFLEQAHLQDPSNVELLYQTYQAMDQAGQPSGMTLEKFAALSQESMSERDWIKLGEYRLSNNQNESALTAFLKGVNPEEKAPDPETAATIGQLFARVGNTAQATRWLEIAAKTDDPSALPALFGLLEIELAQKKWVDAETTVARLEKQFPGAVEASQWKEASLELKRWRAAQDQMKAKLAEAEEARKQAAEEAARKAREAEEAAKALAETEAAETQKAIAEEILDDHTDDGSGKAQVIEDIEAAEAMAALPAIEPNESEDAEAASGDEAPTGSKAITFDPSIAIEPADPTLTFAVNFDEESTSPETTYSVETATETEVSAVATETRSAFPIRPTEAPKTVEELLTEAETAEIDRDYKTAIQKYWAAITIANNSAEVWNLLSRAYLIDGQLQNADTAALESVRLSPNEVAYTLDFLRVAQRSRPPEEFLSQLETAYDRFPTSPEITLSLARAYERISKNTRIARNLYQRFIDIAPNHPLVPEARDAIARLQ